MTAQIAEFTDAERDLMTLCPTLDWAERGTHFVVFEVADRHSPPNGHRAVWRWS